jgi:hypothetical protein
LRALLSVLACLPLVWPVVSFSSDSDSVDGWDECLKCHKEQKNLEIKRLSKSVHRKAGLVCSDCHGSHRGEIAVPEGFAGADDAAVSAFCVKCHTMKGEEAGSPLPGLSEFLTATCSGCHGTDPVEPPFDWLHAVKSASAGNASCVDCHTPHTKYRPDLASAESALCLAACHREVKREFERYSNHWGLSREVRCVDCHAMHGAAEAPVVAFNIESIPSRIAAYNWVESNETCFDCHREGEIVYGLETGFRDDPSGVNLHALHVIDGLQACLSCHDPHGSTNPYLVRSRLYDRQPLEFFESDETTRRCYVECHGTSHFPEDYRRLSIEN